MLKLNSFRVASLFFSMSLLLLSACKVEVEAKGTVPNIDLKIPATQLGPVFTCSAQLSSQLGGSVQSGVQAPITVKASGGNSPYQILDSAIAFNGETVVARTYENNGTANLSVVDTVVVKDNLGLVTQCNFIVTVTPVNVPPSTLACAMAITPSAPLVNQSTSFVMTASGGVAPYAFSSFAPGLNGTITSALSPISSTQSSATAVYSTAGLRTATTMLTDSNGSQVTCANSVNVNSLPAVSVVASPASSVVAGNTITLTATPANFSGTPTYTFTTSRSGVTIVKTGNTATVNSAIVQSAFTVTVTAVLGSQSASTTISLSFLNPTTLPCTLSHSSGTFYTGDTVQFSVAANSGEALEITGFSTQSDVTTVSSTLSTRSVKYSVAGTKTVLVTARSVSTGALCQGGAQMSDSVVINAQTASLTCSGVTFYNPSYTYEWFRASAVISGGQGLKWVDTITMTKNGSNFYNFDGQWIDSNSAWLAIYTQGTYLVKFNLKDSAGNTGSCTTTQVVYY